MAKPRVSVIVPTYNERENVPLLIERVFSALPPDEAELLFVDDNSPDGTADVARAAAQRLPVRCVVRTQERDLSTAVIHGMQHAAGDLWVVMDADLSHPPEKIPALVDAFDDPQVQMAIGSRFVPGGSVDLHWPLHRRIISRLGRLLARPLTPVRDMVAGFFCVRAGSVDFARLDPLGYKIALELIVRHRWTRVVEIPISFVDRAAGQTKLSLGEQRRYLRHLGRLYRFAWLGRRPTP